MCIIYCTTPTNYATRYRYAARVESAKDRMTYHAFVFLEWDHSHFGTVVELAWKGGVGGYKVGGGHYALASQEHNYCIDAVRSTYEFPNAPHCALHVHALPLVYTCVLL